MNTTIPKWMSTVLNIAAIYNVAWGAFVVLFPNLIFEWCGMEPMRYPMIWQCVGMIVGVYGVGYWLAAEDPIVHYPIVLVGFLGKVFGPIGFAQQLFLGTLPWKFALNIVFNDLIWWVPFFLILRATWRTQNTDV